MRGDIEVPGYTLHEVVGRGGFAVVHRATQVSVDREVAVKLIDTAGLGETALRRFRAETRSVGSLSWHPHVVSVYDAGTLAGDVAYLVMDYLPGGTFGDRAKREGGLPVADAVAAARQLCDALQVAHDADIVHRDVKPENLMIGRRGDAQLADFGIATLADTTRSATGTFIGTVAFSAPELLKGSRADVRSDVFSVGATLHALLTGRSPFVGDDDETAAAVMWRVMAEDPAPLPASVPDGLRALVAACLAKDAAARPGSAAEVMAALDAIAGGPPTPAPAPAPTSPAGGPAPASTPAVAAGERAFPPPPTWTVDGPPIPPPPAAPTPPPAPPPGPAAAPGSSPAERTMVDGRPDPVPPRRGNRLLVGAAVAVLVVLAAAVAVFALSRGDEERADDRRPAATTTATTTTSTEAVTSTTTRRPTTTTTTPNATDIATAVPRGDFQNLEPADSTILECTGWTEGYDCRNRRVIGLRIDCSDVCKVPLWEASVPVVESGGTYRGEVRDVATGTMCEGVPQLSTVTIEFTVTEATYLTDTWVANVLVGQARITNQASACTDATILAGFTLRRT